VSISSFFGAILNSHNKFAAAAATPIILNLILIGILLFGKFLNDDLVHYLSYGVSIAGFLQLIFLYKFVKKFYSIDINFKLRINKNVKLFFKKLLPSIFSSGVTQINILVGTIIASFQASAVSYLYYADRIYQINLAIAGIAIGVVILPQLSKYVYQKKKKKILIIQNKALELSMFLCLPASVALSIGSEQIISALFGYGLFNEEAAYNSAKALYYFGLGLPAFALIKVFSTFFFANHDTKTPFYISMISVGLNIVLSIYYFKSLGFIIIPIATTISSWFNSIILFIFLKNKKIFSFNEIFFVRLGKIFFASIMMGLFFKYLVLSFENQLVYDYNFKSLYLILSVFLAIVFYLLLSLLIKAFKYEDIKLKY
jgi:putative peptidoglycan lipid II flippase